MRNFEKKIVTIESTPQTVTTGWVDCGTVQNVNGYDYCNLYVDIVINNSQNVRLRAVSVPADSTTVYTLPIQSVSSSVVQIEAHYFEFNVDANQSMMLPFDFSGATQVKFQIQAGTVGATGATVALKGEFYSKQ